MSKYIDKDKLVEEVLSSWYKDTHASVQASYIHGQEHRHLMGIIEKQPIHVDLDHKNEIATEVLDDIIYRLSCLTVYNTISISPQQLRDIAAELKKKYSEGDNNGRTV